MSVKIMILPCLPCVPYTNNCVQFVPLPILQELGYHDVSTARTELYRKTKVSE